MNLLLILTLCIFFSKEFTFPLTKQMSSIIEVLFDFFCHNNLKIMASDNMLSDDILISIGPSIVIPLPSSMAERIKRLPVSRAVKLTLRVAFWFTVNVVIIFEAWLEKYS